MTTWRKEIAKARERAGDKSKLVASTLSETEMDAEFDDGSCCTEGVPFTAWTIDRVYFPVCYDGAEWVESVPRFPCDEKTAHVGG